MAGGSFPPCAAGRRGRITSWPDRHAREVHEAEQLIATINRRSPQDREWLDEVKRLHTALEGHIREEEQDIWPKVERVWNRTQLEEAGKEMEAMKAEGGDARATK
jgi:hypothetical protein